MKKLQILNLKINKYQLYIKYFEKSAIVIKYIIVVIAILIIIAIIIDTFKWYHKLRSVKL